MRIRTRAGSLRIKPPGGEEFLLDSEWRDVDDHLGESIRSHVNVEVGTPEPERAKEPEPPEPVKATKKPKPSEE